MKLNQETRARIIQEESIRFLDSQFAGLDLSGSPDLNNPIADKFEPCDRDGLSNVDVSGLPATNQLKQFVSQPDAETLARVAQETGDPGLIERVRDDREVAEAKAFMAAHPSYYRDDSNYEAIREYIQDRDLPFNRDNLAIAYKALSRAGTLQADPATPRPLTDHSLRAIALQAASGDVEGAVGRYLQMRMPEQASEMWMYSTSLQEALDGIAAPEYQGLVQEAVWFAWEQGRPNYSPTSERRSFLQDYIAGRIPTARLLDEAWAACQAAEKDSLRSALFGQVAPLQTELEQQPDLESLSDVQIDRLYNDALRKNAVEAVRQRRGVGILR
jgi:hypothetical protein